MTASRGVAVIGGTALLVAWIAAAADSARSSRVIVIERERPRELTRAELIAADIQSQASRLRDRLASAPMPAGGGRNPFRFSEPAPAPHAMKRVASAAGLADSDRLPEGDEVEVPATVPLTLSGIAEDSSTDGTIRTAILSGLGDVFLAKPGDMVVSRFRVVAVGADAVEILDTATGTTVRLGLR